MTPFLLTLCKHSLLAAAVLALAAITKPLWRERYGARSRCALWLALAVFLLLPVDWSAPNAPVRVEPPAERTLLLSAQRGPSVVRTDELPRRQETVLTGENDTSPLPVDPPVTFEEAYGTAPDNGAKNVPLTGLLFLIQCFESRIITKLTFQFDLLKRREIVELQYALNPNKWNCCAYDE